jgi:hypothetical protein
MAVRLAATAPAPVALNRNAEFPRKRHGDSVVRQSVPNKKQLCAETNSPLPFAEDLAYRRPLL